MTIFLIVILPLLGGAWRRWWGSERPSWAPGGYRAAQAIAGALILTGLLLLLGQPLWYAGIKAVLAIAFLAESAQSLPFVWHMWDDIDSRWQLPKLGRWFTGHTTYAEATCGALVFGLAALI